jgi:hypothetical protein
MWLARSEIGQSSYFQDKVRVKIFICSDAMRTTSTYCHASHSVTLSGSAARLARRRIASEASLAPNHRVTLSGSATRLTLTSIASEASLAPNHRVTLSGSATRLTLTSIASEASRRHDARDASAALSMTQAGRST